jgi:tRNA-5-methyluridine54 2-sulfurtransferase
VLRGIDYQLDECPNAVGNRHLGFKEALNAVEDRSPGTKHAFYFEFLDKASDRFRPEAEAEQEGLRPCAGCAEPTVAELCAFCALVARVAP